MKPFFTPLKRIVLQVLLLAGIYLLSRCCFALINAGHFKGLDAFSFLKLCFYGLRYDLSAIFALNTLYFLLLLLPLPVWRMPRWLRFTQVVFIGINIVAFLFELSDWAYFPYNFKRSTSDVLKMVGRKGDFWSLLPRFFIDYWYVPVAVGVLAFLFIQVNKRICRATPMNVQPSSKPRFAVAGIYLGRIAVLAGVALMAIRGGLQYIPIGLRNAVQVTESRYVPIVVNTPFSIITSYTTPALEELHYMPEAAAEAVIRPIKDYYLAAQPFQKKNVVVIILESFSREFTKLGNGRSYTPFLDSLMDESIVCTQGYANASTSAEGIPAIISGIPTLMREAFTTSNYGTNRIDALPGLLKKKGYETAFYHGGTNGTMSFDIFAAAAGYDHYYGRSEYHNERDYDGNWGIPDEPFLQYFAAGLSKMKPPFAASVFTLSSHPPYKIPSKYKERFKPGKLPVYAVVSYADLALREFFETAAKQIWYANTLFVITADHCSPQTGGGYYDSNMGRFAIPVLFFAPGDALRGRHDEPMQQLDILPSVLDYLHYDQPFFAFGNSIFRKDSLHYVVNELNGSYQWLKDGYLLQTKEASPTGLFAFPADSNCAYNQVRLLTGIRQKRLYDFKAFLQFYRSSLIHNKMTAQ